MDFAQPVFGIGSDVENLNRAPLEHGAPGDRASVNLQGVGLEEFNVITAVADGGAGPILVAFAPHDESHFGVA